MPPPAGITIWRGRSEVSFFSVGAGSDARASASSELALFRALRVVKTDSFRASSQDRFGTAPADGIVGSTAPCTGGFGAPSPGTGVSARDPPAFDLSSASCVSVRSVIRTRSGIRFSSCVSLTTTTCPMLYPSCGQWCRGAPGLSLRIQSFFLPLLRARVFAAHAYRSRSEAPACERPPIPITSSRRGLPPASRSSRCEGAPRAPPATSEETPAEATALAR